MHFTQEERESRSRERSHYWLLPSHFQRHFSQDASLGLFNRTQLIDVSMINIQASWTVSLEHNDQYSGSF